MAFWSQSDNMGGGGRNNFSTQIGHHLLVVFDRHKIWGNKSSKILTKNYQDKNAVKTYHKISGKTNLVLLLGLILDNAMIIDLIKKTCSTTIDNS